MKKIWFVAAIFLFIIFNFSGCKGTDNISKEAKSINSEIKVTNDTQKDINPKSDEKFKNEDNEIKNKEDNIIRIGWQFRSFNKISEDNSEYPYTEVFLLIQGKENEKISLGSYIGDAWEVEDFTNRDLPPEVKIACQSWYAGSGDNLCVTVEDKKLHVKWRLIEEVGPDAADYVVPKYKDIKVIDTPDNAIIETMKATKQAKENK